MLGSSGVEQSLKRLVSHVRIMLEAPHFSAINQHKLALKRSEKSNNFFE